MSEKSHNKLPSWLREGLEKIKQEKQKKLDNATPNPPGRKPNEPLTPTKVFTVNSFLFYFIFDN